MSGPALARGGRAVGRAGGRAVPALAHLALACAALAACPPGRLTAQARPGPGPTPTVPTPRIERATLPNGLDVWLVTRRELPIVNAQLVVRAGSALDGERAGLAEMTAALMDEGAGGRSALEVAQAVSDLGASLSVGADVERMTVSLSALSRHLGAALPLMGDVVVRPRFEQAELDRERAQRLQALRRQKDDPAQIATLRFNALVYGAEHPYGRPAQGTEASVQAVTRDDVIAFHRTWVRPNNAFLVVVGDVTMADLRRQLTRAFAGWEQAPVPAAGQAIPPRPALRPTTVYLVDKPGAAQSQIRIGHPGAPRTSADYATLQVLNSALGGAFTSRINLNLREQRGFTYGARSSFSWDRGDGPFIASAGVFTAKTDSSLVEFMKELRDVRGPRPVSATEAEYNRGAIVRAYPRTLETGASVAGVLATLAFHRLPEREITDYLARVQRVTPAQLTAAARRYLQPDSAVIVVVGDLKVIREGVEGLGLGEVRVIE